MDAPSVPELSPEERAERRKARKRELYHTRYAQKRVPRAQLPPETLEMLRAYDREWKKKHHIPMAQRSDEERARINARKKLQGQRDRARRPHAHAEARARYQARHPERIRALQRLREQANAQRIAEQHRARRAANSAHMRRLEYAWRKAHPERSRQYTRAWRERNIESRRLYDHTYAQANPDKIREKGARRRARERNAPVNDFTAKQWRAMCKAAGYLCAYCRQKFSFKDLTQDHITPLSKGGAHTLSNIIPACRSCNSRKHTKDVLAPVQPFLLLDEGAAD